MAYTETSKGETKQNPEAEEDDSSPRAVLDIPIMGGNDSDHSGSSGSFSSSSCVSPTSQKSMVGQSQSQSQNQSQSHGGGSQWKSVIDGLKKKSMRRLSTISSFTASYDLSRKNYLRRKLARIRSAEDGIECSENHEIPVPKPSWRNFDFAELAAATDNFSSGKRFSLFFYFPCLFLFLNILILELKPTQPNRLRNLISGLIIIMFLKKNHVSGLITNR